LSARGRREKLAASQPPNRAQKPDATKMQSLNLIRPFCNGTNDKCLKNGRESRLIIFQLQNLLVFNIFRASFGAILQQLFLKELSEMFS